MALAIQEIQSLDRAALNRMTSDSYRAEMEGSNAEIFKARVDAIENSPHTSTRPRGNVRDAAESASTPTNTFADSPEWADEPAVAAAPAAVAAEPIAATVESELPILIHEYQPLDKAGRPVGGKQVFKYKTQTDLISQLSKAHMASSARIRELSRNKTLETIVAAGATPRVQPEKEVPNTVEGLAAELRAQRESNFILSVRAALSEFQASADWSKYRSKENAESIVLAVSKAGADPTDPQSYHDALLRMRDFIEPVTEKITEVPVPAAAPVATVVAEPKAAAAAAPVAQPRFATGISNADLTSEESPIEPVVQAKGNGAKFNVNGKVQVLTIRDLERMSADDTKRLLRSPQNAQAADALYSAEEERKAAARRGR